MDTSKRKIFSKEALSQAKPIEPPRCAIKMGYKPFEIGIKGAFAFAAPSAEVKNCAACFGQGMLIENNTAKACHNPPLTKIINNFNAAEIPAKYQTADVDSFCNFSGNGKAVIKQINQWKKQFDPSSSRGIVVTGPIGVGKSYLMAALARFFVEQGMSVKFTDFFQLLAELRAGYSKGESDVSVLGPLIEVDVLIIDELGKGRNKDFELTILDQLVSERYKRNKTIIGSTNYQLKGSASAHAFNYDLDSAYSRNTSDFNHDSFGPLEQRVGQRIFSRLKEMTYFIEIEGKDMRSDFAKQ